MLFTFLACKWAQRLHIERFLGSDCARGMVVDLGMCNAKQLLNIQYVYIPEMSKMLFEFWTQGIVYDFFVSQHEAKSNFIRNTWYPKIS